MTCNLPLVTAGALLHDLGKTPCLGTLTNHAELGAGILEALGYPHVAQVVREHVHLDGTIMDPRPLREAEVVNYADKRVLHDAVVTLEARFADLKVRYGRTPEALARIQATEVRSRALEEKIFAPLRLSPGSAPGQWKKDVGRALLKRGRASRPPVVRTHPTKAALERTWSLLKADC